VKGSIVTLAPSPIHSPEVLAQLDHRIARLDEPVRPRWPRRRRILGYLVTRVATHWDTVGPHAAPLHVNPSERLEWRVHFTDDRHAELFCDDVTMSGTRAVDELAAGRFVVEGRRVRATWLAGAEAESAWGNLGW
jgi:hypothetical protein